ncbi:MAG: hypothetical protein HOV76_24370 [Hamadaea sp.]|nr:hypothetical protein [Hamadaea sp.]
MLEGEPVDTKDRAQQHRLTGEDDPILARDLEKRRESGSSQPVGRMTEDVAQGPLKREDDLTSHQHRAKDAADDLSATCPPMNQDGCREQEQSDRAQDDQRLGELPDLGDGGAQLVGFRGAVTRQLDGSRAVGSQPSQCPNAYSEENGADGGSPKERTDKAANRVRKIETHSAE